MEVHHPHHPTHNKKWAEYLLEFLMLFFAVFLGFLSENYFEYRVERHKEHDYLISLQNDLKLDTSNINKSIIASNLMLQAGKKMSAVIYNYDNSLENEIKLYRYGISITSTFISVPFSLGTITQLKNSGGLRLIRNIDILNAISEYDNNYRLIESQLESVNLRQTEVLAAERPIFYHKVWINNGSKVEVDTNIVRSIFTKKGTSLFSKNMEDLITLDNTEQAHSGYTYFYNQMCIKQKERAISLINLINKEYAIK
jgi:hypothetical protein